MNILIFSEYYYPERFLISEIAERLVEEGNRVTVVTGLPNYGFPNGEVLPEYKNGSHNNEVVNGVNILRCNVRGRKTGTINLLINYFSYAVNANRLAKNIDSDYDVIYLYQLTPILQAFPAIQFAKKKKIPIVCYCLDLAPECGQRLIGKYKLFGCLYARFSKWAYRQFNKVAVTSKAFIEYLSSVNKVDIDRICYLPQHASDTLLKCDLCKYPTGSPRVFMFAGNIGKGPNLQNIVLAADKVVHNGITDFQIQFVGGGSYKETLVKLVSDMQLNEYVKFFDAVPMHEMSDVYKRADALIVTLRKGQKTVPGKLQAYMATGKPIIASMDSSGREMIEEADCGICVPADDYVALSEAISDYIERPLSYQKYGENGKKYFIENFTINTHIMRLIDILHMVANDK